MSAPRVAGASLGRALHHFEWSRRAARALRAFYPEPVYGTDYLYLASDDPDYRRSLALRRLDGQLDRLLGESWREQVQVGWEAAQEPRRSPLRVPQGLVAVHPSQGLADVYERRGAAQRRRLALWRRRRRRRLSFGAACLVALVVLPTPGLVGPLLLVAASYGLAYAVC